MTQDGLGRIKESARIATELMDRTTALVRPTNIVPREIALDEFLNQLLPTFEKLRGVGAKIDIQCAGELPVAWADPSRVRLALTELVKNACEATVSGGRVSILVEPFTPAGQPQTSQWASISVIDGGAGLAAGIAGQMYEPFTTTKKQAVASGLGLAVAMGCMQQIGGAIDHQCLPGKTMFRLIIPARQAAEIRAAA